MTKNTPPLIYNRVKGGISIVIYIDILFIINFFINFLLLEVTAKLTKKNAKLYRLIISSAVGGAYSFIMFVDELPEIVLAISKIIVAFVMVLIAFSFHRVSSFFLTSIVFLFSSFVFLGVIVGLYYLTKTDMIVINNSTVYFDIGARGLLLSAFVAYLLSCLIVRLHNKRLSKTDVYSIEIFNENLSVKLNALVDTGNKLYEPFSNSPVIVVDKKKVEKLLGNSKCRYIPATTVSGETLLTAFKPEKIIIKSSGCETVVDNAYVALSNDVKANGFSAVINPMILSI